MTPVLRIIRYNWDMSDKEKEYPEPPEGIRVLKNGAGYSETEKRIVHGPGTYGPSEYQITKGNNAEFQRRRWEKARETAAQAIANGTQQPDVFGGWRTVIQAQTELAITPKAGRASTEAAKFVGRAADLLPDQRQAQPDNAPAVQINITSDALREILSTTGGQVIDGNWTE